MVTVGDIVMAEVVKVSNMAEASWDLACRFYLLLLMIMTMMMPFVEHNNVIFLC